MDIITFGSPCQDMSIAGKRAGLDGERSGLFHEAIRIVKEMREKTNGEKPGYLVWENVPGAFTSSKGEDFKAVLSEICSVKGASLPEDRPSKWEYRGEVLGDDFSIAWRTLDARYWGAPQRRRRIYLVADLGGQRAGKILFESEGVSGYSPESFRAWKGSAGDIAKSTGEAGTYICLNDQGKLPEDSRGLLCLNDQGGQRMNVTEDATCALRAEAHHPPVIPVENHPLDSRVTLSENEVSQTLTERMGTGGKNVPPVMQTAFGIGSKFSRGMLSDNPHSGFYEAETARTLDGNGGNPSANQGGIAVVSVQGSMIGRSEKNGPQGDGVNEDASFTLNAVDRHAVAFADVHATLSANGGPKGPSSQMLGNPEENFVAEVDEQTIYSLTTGCYMQVNQDLAATPQARDYKDPPIVNESLTDKPAVNEPIYVVRRLTPTECGRLQGFPNGWCDRLAIPEPTEEDILYWADVFETYRNATGSKAKPKNRNAIIKWLQNPVSDSAMYKMWGNGVALPCVAFVLSGIVWADEKGTDDVEKEPEGSVVV